MEIAGRDHEIFVGANRRIVGRGVDLRVDHRFYVVDRIFRSAVYLRNATERVGILDVSFRLLDQFAAFQELLDASCRIDLSFVRSDRVNSWRKRLGTAFVGVERHHGDLVGPIAELHSLEKSPNSERAHVLRTIQECQTFFGS